MAAERISERVLESRSRSWEMSRSSLRVLARIRALHLRNWVVGSGFQKRDLRDSMVINKGGKGGGLGVDDRMGEAPLIQCL